MYWKRMNDNGCLTGAPAAGGEVFIPGLSDSSGDDVEEGEVRGEAPPAAAAKATTLAGVMPPTRKCRCRVLAV